MIDQRARYGKIVESRRDMTIFYMLFLFSEPPTPSPKSIPRPLALGHLPLLAVGHVLLELSDFLRRVDVGVLGLDLSEGHRGDHLLLAGCLFGLRMLLCLYRKNRHGLSGWLERF